MMAHDRDGWPNPDPLRPDDDPDPRVPASSSWEHQRERAVARRRPNWPCLAVALGLVAFWVAVIAALAVIATPSSAETTAPVDVSGMLSARLSGAPQIPRHWPPEVGRVQVSGTLHDAGTRRRRPTSSPAVANVATSGGPSGPTTSMSATTISGLAGWASASLGSSYLAMRLPRHTLVTISGPGGTWTTRTTDYGPSSRIRPPRVADVAAGEWERLCGLPLSAGLCRVAITVDGPRPTAPATDATP